MYKITLYDRNCPSCCSGTEEFYCDNIDEFERKWLRKENDEATIERFRRSKNGECVTDYYSDDPELDIVQYDGDAAIYHELKETWNDRTLELHNSYRWPGTYHIKGAEIHLRYVCFKGVYMEQAAYRLEGICMESLFGDKKYHEVTCWGNRVLEHHRTNPGYSDNQEDYKGEVIESFVYFPVKRFKTKEKMEEAYHHRQKKGLNEEELDHLFRDIPGESG